MTLGENIVRLRTNKNWSQSDLAEALEVSRQSVSKWETDTSIPELDKLLKLSELFGVTLDELVNGEENSKVGVVSVSEHEKHHSIAGMVLLCTGVVIMILCLLFAGDLLAGLLLASPFMICGVICFVVKKHVGLYCAWIVYLCVDLYLRFAAGLSWTTIFMTHIWTAQMNYTRLVIAWVQFIGMITMIVCTACSYRTLKLPMTKKEVTWLIIGWFVVIVMLPIIMSYGVMPLWMDDLESYNNLYFFVNILYSYLRLALANVLLVRSLAVWRMRR